MPKKKGQKKTTTGIIDRSVDFTLNDCANASKPVHRLKKSTTPEGVTEDLSWDQIEDNDLDIIEETNEDGTKSFVYKKRQNHSKSEGDIDQRPGIVYPEIVWYLISQYISPEAIGCFAGINKATYAITKKESFWRSIYNKYCRNNPSLPHRLRIENSYKAYGLRQRVIRALYYTHDVFLRKVIHESMHDSKPHQLVKRCCTNVWYNKGLQYWSVFFTFKKLRPREKMSAVNFLEDLGSIDANPEEDTKVLTVTCLNFYDIPPLMGMTLSSVKVMLSQGFCHHRMYLGFNTGFHVSKDVVPECTVVLDTVVNICVFDWWHPKYPHFESKLRVNLNGEESVPVLKKNFFKINDADA